MIRLRGRDPRRVMAAVEAAFRSGDAEALAALEALAASPAPSTSFYASLYRGLLAEANGEAAIAKKWIARAVASDYAASGDYMYALARVHEARRR